MGHLPKWRMGFYGAEEAARRKVIFGLANCKVEDLVALEERFGISVDELCGREFNALKELGLLEVAHRGVQYTDLGLARLEEITYFLSSKYVKDMCDAPLSKQDPKYKALINQHANIPPLDRHAFEDFVRKQPDVFMKHISNDTN